MAKGLVYAYLALLSKVPAYLCAERKGYGQEFGFSPGFWRRAPVRPPPPKVNFAIHFLEATLEAVCAGSLQPKETKTHFGAFGSLLIPLQLYKKTESAKGETGDLFLGVIPWVILQSGGQSMILWQKGGVML